MIETIEQGQLKWHHVLNPSEEDFDFLLNTYHFHPLDIEDCRSINQRPKIDEYDDYYFLILHFPYFDKGNKFIRIKEVKIFWGKDFVITIGKSHWVVKNLFTSVKEGIEKDIEEQKAILNSSDSLLYNVLNKLMQETYTLILRIGSEVDLLNYDIFNRKAQKIIELISVTRRNIILLNTTFKPQLRLFHKFESGGIQGFVPDMEDYWGNILDQYQKMFDMVEDYGELIEGLSRTFDSLQANSTNETMKVLTYFSTTMLPLSVITGFYGMNISLPFSEGKYAFIFLVIFMIIVTVGLLFFFKRNQNRN